MSINTQSKQALRLQVHALCSCGNQTLVLMLGKQVLCSLSHHCGLRQVHVHVYRCFAGMHILYHVNAWCSLRQEEGVRNHGTEVTDAFELGFKSRSSGKAAVTLNYLSHLSGAIFQPNF